MAYDRMEKKGKSSYRGEYRHSVGRYTRRFTFFVSSLSGTENLYLQNPINLYTTTNSRFGINEPEINGTGSSSQITPFRKQHLSVPGFIRKARGNPRRNRSFLINSLMSPKSKVKSDEPADYTPVSTEMETSFQISHWMPFSPISTPYRMIRLQSVRVLPYCRRTT